MTEAEALEQLAKAGFMKWAGDIPAKPSCPRTGCGSSPSARRSTRSRRASAMSDSWEIHLPIRDPSEPLDADALTGLPAALPKGPEREMARKLLFQGRVEYGFETVGQVVDWLQGLDGPGRRRVLDLLRDHVGLPSTGDVEARERIEAANRNAQLVAAETSPWQVCPADGCGEIPINALGSPIPVDCRRWWCPTHQHLAAAGDLEPRPSRLVIKWAVPSSKLTRPSRPARRLPPRRVLRRRSTSRSSGMSRLRKPRPSRRRFASATVAKRQRASSGHELVVNGWSGGVA